VLGQVEVVPLSILRARTIGVMQMCDQNEEDDKILAVHADDPEYREYRDVSELPEYRLKLIKRFFEDYKALEHKQVIVEDMLGPEKAVSIIAEALELYRRLRRGELSRLKHP